MANRLQVVSSRLLDALMSSYRCVPCCSGQIFAIFVWNMFAFAVLVALSQTEINDIDVISGRFSASNQEIIGLDIPMNNSLLVDLLDALDELDGNHEDGLQVEVALAGLEEVFEGGSEQVHHHDMELLVGHRAVRADVVEAWYARLPPHLVDQLRFPEKHRVPLILLSFFL